MPAPIPLVSFQVAPSSPLTGQTSTQGGLSHCMQGFGRKVRETFGYVPCSYSRTGRYFIAGGSLFSEMQAIVQAWQPTHLRRSSSMAQRRSFSGFCRARSRSCCIVTRLSVIKELLSKLKYGRGIVVLSVTPVAVAGDRKCPLAVMAGAARFARHDLIHVALVMMLDIAVQLVVAFGAVQLLHGAGLMPEDRFLADHHIAMAVWCRGGTPRQNGNYEQKQDFLVKHHLVAS